MKKTSAILTAVAALTFCSNGAKAASPAPAPWRQADFAADLYRHAAAEAGKNENVVLSPWGVANLFALLQTGARGDTARGMAFALQLGGAEPPAPDAVAATFREARTNLSRATRVGVTLLSHAAREGVALELSDSLWLAPNFEVAPDFAARAREAFDAEARTTEMGAAGRTNINAFVAEKTHNRIKDLIQPPALDDPLTRLVAVDTVYLKATWQSPFDKMGTRIKAVFHAPDGDVMVPSMHASREAEILDASECAALRLPYRFNTIEMLVILPSPSNTLADVEAKLSGPWLDRLAASPWRGEAIILMPKFTFDSAHNLKPILEPMGMGAAFDQARADFSGIAPKLFVGAAMQKVNITVDENGTEAAAATDGVLRCTSLFPGNRPPPRLFVANRPFLFIIRETRTGLILFIGRVCKPAASQDRMTGFAGFTDPLSQNPVHPDNPEILSKNGARL